MSDESPGMLALQAGVLKQVLPHTIDAREWAKEFNATACKLGYQVMDEGWLVAWFANAIMAGYDTATMRLAADNAALRLKVQELEQSARVNQRAVYAEGKVRELLKDRDKLEARLTTLEALVKALPTYKNITVIHRIDENDYESWHIWANHNPLVECDTEEEVNALAALLTHRQGMGG